MKMRWLKHAVIGLGLLPIFSGCVEHHAAYVERPPVGTVSTQVVVTEPPPPIRHEVRVVSPGAGYVWVPGSWSWHDRWVWREGRWVAGPHPGARWHEGYWKHHGNTYVWVEGYWH